MWNLWKNNGCQDFTKPKLVHKKRSALHAAVPYRLSDNIRYMCKSKTNYQS